MFGIHKKAGTATGTTFAVADVAPAATSLDEVPYREAVQTAIGKGQIESCPSRLCKTLVPCEYNPFIACVQRAFNDHRPLLMSPDHIWLLICQGFANHLNANAEKLRSRLVSFEGKEKIAVRRDDFVKGAMENPWEAVFPEFATKLRAYIGSTADLLSPTFSTTGPVEVAACQIVLMDAMKSYFDFEFASGCGIPQITLTGTPDDWSQIQQRAQAFRAFDIDWWIDPLTDVLGHFCKATEGQVDRDWWNSFYKIGNASGGPFVNGHILKFFPYLRNYKTKKATIQHKFPPVDSPRPFDGVTIPDFPKGQSKVPFVWNYFQKQCEMEFLGGFVGVRQDRKTKRLQPEIGWAVRETNADAAN
jgi:hypothetical protein